MEYRHTFNILHRELHFLSNLKCFFAVFNIVRDLLNKLNRTRYIGLYY